MASTDAVNGSQLYVVGANVNTLGATTAAALGGGSTYVAGSGVSAPNYSVQGRSYSSVGSAFGAVDNSLNTMGAQIGSLQQNVGSLQQNVSTLQQDVRRGYEGTAVAIASTGPTISRDTKFGISGKWGSFRGQNAVGFMAQARLNNNIVFNASVGAGLNYGAVDMARSVFVGGGVGRWANPVKARPHSSAVIRRSSLIGHLIALSFFQSWVLLKVVLIQAEPGIRSRDRLYVKTDFMVQTMRLRLEDSKDRESDSSKSRGIPFCLPGYQSVYFQSPPLGSLSSSPPSQATRLFFRMARRAPAARFLAYLRSTTCDRLGPLV